jgi:hypothetical protein
MHVPGAFAQTAEDWTTDTLRHRPEAATSLGVHDYDAELGDRSRAAIEGRAPRRPAPQPKGWGITGFPAAPPYEGRGRPSRSAANRTGWVGGHTPTVRYDPETHAPASTPGPVLKAGGQNAVVRSWVWPVAAAR